MKVNVKLFAKANQLVGSPEIELNIPQGSTVSEFKSILLEEHPELKPIMPTLFVALNAEYANDEDTIKEGIEVACFPPVSGG